MLLFNSNYGIQMYLLR